VTCVALDAFALLVMLLGEPVADKVKAALSGADPGGSAAHWRQSTSGFFRFQIALFLTF
jgi:hypothetical protein